MCTAELMLRIMLNPMLDYYCLGQKTKRSKRSVSSQVSCTVYPSITMIPEVFLFCLRWGEILWQSF